MDVAHKFEQEGITIHENSLVSSLKEMPRTIVAPVDPAGVTERETLHDAGQRRGVHLHYKVNMVSHEAECVDTVPEPLYTLLQEKVETVTVVIIEKDPLPIVAAEDHVIDCAGIVNSGFACHAGTISHKSPDAKPDP